MKDHNLEFSIEKINDESSIYTCAGKKIQFYQGDFFNMPEDGKFRDFDLIWDRASMVAVNPPDREKYANKIKYVGLFNVINLNLFLISVI